MAAGATEEILGPLLNVLAQSLDVQEVFARISALARQTVPHDCLLFGLVTADGERYRVVAVSEDDQRAALLGTSFAPPSPGLAHERVAEEERRRAEAQERAVQLEGRVARLTAELEVAEGHRAIGASKPWREVLTQAAKVAPTETTVLLTGESGTGKEVVAHLIHRGSRRAEGPFV